EGAGALDGEKAQHEQQRSYGDQGAKRRHDRHDRVYRFSPGEPVHAAPLAFWMVARTRTRASACSSTVTPNSTKPSSIRDCRKRSPVASVNSLAITAAIEYPGAKSEA